MTKCSYIAAHVNLSRRKQLVAFVVRQNEHALMSERILANAYVCMLFFHIVKHRLE